MRCSERIALEQVYYQGWKRSPAQVGCMRQVLGADALGRPRGIRWGGRWEWGLGWGTHVNPWLVHVNVWQKPLQYCKVMSLQLIKINEIQTKTSDSLIMIKHLTVWITTNCGKFLKKRKYQATSPVSWETCLWVKKQQLEPHLEQLTGSKLGKEYDKAVHCQSPCLTYMQSTSCEILG